MPDYIPKYIIKRLVPPKFVRKEGNEVKFKFVNIVAPLTFADEFPEDLSGSIKVTVDDKEIPEEYIFDSELIIQGKTS